MALAEEIVMTGKKMALFMSAFLMLITTMLNAALPQRAMNNIDRIINQAMQQDGIPGLAVGVTQNGEPVLMKGYGFANMQTQQPVTANTRFGIGSVSKVITGFAVMNLVQQGKIGLDDSILKYIPDAPAQWKAVTIRQLLSHTSGIPQHQGPNLPWKKTWAEMANQPMEFKPGSSFKYNNFGFKLLGRVVEIASGQSLPDYLNATIFAPLGMSQTGFPNTLLPQGLAMGYRYANGQVRMNANEKPWIQMWGSGGIVSTITDMVAWDLAMYAGKILEPATYRLMWTPVFLTNGQPSGRNGLSWALGWQVSYRNGKLVAQKDGAIRGYSSFMVRHIDDKITVIILTNNKKTHLRKLAKQIFRQVKFSGNPPQNPLQQRNQFQTQGF